MLGTIGLLFAVTAAFAYVNHYLLRLPRTIGLLVLALAVSVGAIAFDQAVPAADLSGQLRRALGRIDFASFLLDAVLAFLLFADAVEMDVAALASRKGTILALATAGVLISTLLMAGGIWGVFRIVGIDMPMNWCLVFGALIAPTDPVAVLDVLDRLGVSSSLHAIAAGESLFNDGVAIVLYGLFLANATAGGAVIGPADFALAFVLVGGGGLVLGLATGSVAFLATRGIDEYNIELLISLSLVTGTYGLAQAIGVSGPVAVVVAGLLMGSIGLQYAVSATTHDYLSKFWSLVEELFNSLLFLLIGFQFAVISLDWRYFAAAGFAIPLALVVRFLSVAIPSIPLNLNEPNKLRAIALLTWGGLRGGIAVALALSLPAGPEKPALLSVCYGVVLFTMIVQGLSLGRIANWLFPTPDEVA